MHKVIHENDYHLRKLDNQTAQPSRGYEIDINRPERLDKWNNYAVKDNWTPSPLRGNHISRDRPEG